MELFERANNFLQVISFLDQNHKFFIRNEVDDNFLILEPASGNEMFNIKLKTSEKDISLSKPILKEYISRIAYYLGFRFENFILEDTIPI